MLACPGRKRAGGSGLLFLKISKREPLGARAYNGMSVYLNGDDKDLSKSPRTELVCMRNLS
jgi:hypothetical protein